MTSDNADRIAKKYSQKATVSIDGKLSTPSPRMEKAKRALRKTGLWAAGIAVAAGIGYGVLKYEHLTTRQDYPIRNVLYQAKEEVKFIGTGEKASLLETSMNSETTLQRGDPFTKIGDIIGRVKYHYTDEFMQYQLEDAAQRRIASASEKHERIQDGADVLGKINFLERQAELIGVPGKFATYSFIPKRGCKDVELNLLFDESGVPSLVNEIVANRDCNPLHLSRGAFDGDNHRAGTELNIFPKTAKNVELEGELFDIVKRFNTHNLSVGDREDLINRMRKIRDNLDKTPVMVSEEDGIFDWLPQESTMYLFGKPSSEARAGISSGKAGVYPTDASWGVIENLQIANPTGIPVKLRIENHWDLWPGRILGLRGVSFGSGRDTLMPFAKYNNGGYEIIDGTGTVAEVRFKDFVLRYGKDVLYEYYLDKDGNGKINDEKELLGSVLFHIDNDESLDLSDALGSSSKKEKKDVSYNLVYSFMRGSDEATAHQDFYLCNAFESFLLNETNRGYGKHSYLGYVNTQRSNILLLETRTVPNLSRAMTIESAIVAEQDMVNLLRAAGRDYVNRYVSVRTPEEPPLVTIPEMPKD